jgi:uncharacterized protein (DUF1800 family)
MAIGPDPKAGFVALTRFAFGARGGAYAGDLARAASDPRGFLKAELLQPGIARLDAPTLPQTKAALQAAYAERERQRMARKQQSASPAPPPATSDAADPKGGANNQSTMTQGESALPPATPPSAMKEQPKPPEPPLPQRLFRADALARFQRVARAEVGFAERLVHFWSNHFCVSAAKGPLAASSARPSGRMCSAASATCSRPSRAIRRC